MGGGLSGEGQCLSAVGVGMGGQKCKGDKAVWARGMYVACEGGEGGGLNVIKVLECRGGLVCV